MMDFNYFSAEIALKMRSTFQSLFFCSGILLALMMSACTPKDNCVEKPDPDCVCTMEYNPVCGCNQKTYSNPCMAECNGIMEYRSGPCEKS